MFIIPHKEKESGLNAALRGLSGVADVVSKAVTEYQGRKAQRNLAENPNFANIINADLDPREKVALLDAIVQGGPNALQPPSRRQSYTEEPPEQEFEQESPQQKSGGLKPIPMPSEAQIQDWTQRYGQKGVRARLDQIEEHNKRVQQQQDKRANIRFEKNIEAGEKVTNTAKASREVLEIAHNLKSLTEGGKLSDPGKHYLSRITGIPITKLGGSVGDEQFIKGAKALVAPYLAKNYGGKGVGRVLQTEALAAQQALVTGENSKEAKKALIQSIIDLAEEDIDAQKDFNRALDLYEEDDPRIQRYVEEQSEKRLRKRLDKLSNKSKKIAKVLPETGELIFFKPGSPELAEFEAEYGT